MIKENKNVLNIAFATSNERDLDEHFGSCQQFIIYRLSLENKEHINTIKFTAYEGHNQQKISDRLTVLEDCFAVYCLACGNPVRKLLLEQGTRVVIHPHIESIDKILSKVQANWPGKIALRQARQINKKQDDDYFNKLADSEWG